MKTKRLYRFVFLFRFFDIAYFVACELKIIRFATTGIAVYEKIVAWQFVESVLDYIHERREKRR